jgi:hypothetical protein
VKYLVGHWSCRRIGHWSCHSIGRWSRYRIGRWPRLWQLIYWWGHVTTLPPFIRMCITPPAMGGGGGGLQGILQKYF